MSVLVKLMDARIALQSRKLTKSGRNAYAGYEYFELGDFLPVVQEIFLGLGLCGVVSYTKEIAKLTITDTEDGTAVEITSPMGSAALKGCHEVQNIGAVETYQRRYLWVTAMEIVEHDAVDSAKPLGRSEVQPNAAGQDYAHNADAETKAKLDERLGSILDCINAGEVQRAQELFYADDLDEMEKAAIWTMIPKADQKAISRKERK